SVHRLIGSVTCPSASTTAIWLMGRSSPWRAPRPGSRPAFRAEPKSDASTGELHLAVGARVDLGQESGCERELGSHLQAHEDALAWRCAGGAREAFVLFCSLRSANRGEVLDVSRCGELRHRPPTKTAYHVVAPRARLQRGDPRNPESSRDLSP